MIESLKNIYGISFLKMTLEFILNSIKKKIRNFDNECLEM